MKITFIFSVFFDNISNGGRGMINDKQKSQFEVFGFLIIKQMFSPEEVEIITT